MIFVDSSKFENQYIVSEQQQKSTQCQNQETVQQKYNKMSNQLWNKMENTKNYYKENTLISNFKQQCKLNSKSKSCKINKKSKPLVFQIATNQLSERQNNISKFIPKQNTNKGQITADHQIKLLNTMYNGLQQYDRKKNKLSLKTYPFNTLSLFSNKKQSFSYGEKSTWAHTPQNKDRINQMNSPLKIIKDIDNNRKQLRQKIFENQYLKKNEQKQMKNQKCLLKSKHNKKIQVLFHQNRMRANNSKIFNKVACSGMKTKKYSQQHKKYEQKIGALSVNIQTGIKINSICQFAQPKLVNKQQQQFENEDMIPNEFLEIIASNKVNAGENQRLYSSRVYQQGGKLIGKQQQKKENLYKCCTARNQYKSRSKNRICEKLRNISMLQKLKKNTRQQNRMASIFRKCFGNKIIGQKSLAFKSIIKHF